MVAIGNGNGHPKTGYGCPDVEQIYNYTLSLTSALDGVDGQRHTPAAVVTGKTRYPLYGRLGGPKAGLDGCGKSRLQRDSIPAAVHPVATGYTD